MSDSIVDEIRKFRDEHTRKFNYDLNAICADLMERQKRSGHPLVSPAGRVCEESGEYKVKKNL
jgi:hypothetical protein